jgi:hypothetical protein
VERSRPRLEAAPEQLPRSGDSSSVDIAEPQAQVITSAACWLTTGATINLNLVLGGQPRRRRPSAPAQRQRAGASHALHARRQRRSGDHPAHVTGHSSQLTPRRCPADSTTGPGCQPAHNDPFGCDQNRPPVHRTTAHSGGSACVLLTFCERCSATFCDGCRRGPCLTAPCGIQAGRRPQWPVSCPAPSDLSHGGVQDPV